MHYSGVDHLMFDRLGLNNHGAPSVLELNSHKRSFPRPPVLLPKKPGAFFFSMSRVCRAEQMEAL